MNKPILNPKTAWGAFCLLLVWILIVGGCLLFGSCEPENKYKKIQRAAAKERAEQMKRGEIPVPPPPSVSTYK